MTTCTQFTKAYLDAMHWQAQVVLDPNLMIDYPACTYAFEGQTVIALAEEMQDAVEYIPADANLEQVLKILFEPDTTRATHETVIGFFAQLRQFGEKLPPVVDSDALEQLMDAVDDADRLRGEVDTTDDFSCCIMDQGHMVAAAGAIIEGGLADISVLVHPKWRGHGLGARVTSALIRKVQDAGYIALYRAEINNFSSVRLARHLGLKRGFIMEGALIEFL